ncbi:MAG: NAD-dependent epimerase/dehydratase family protein [Chthoniobacterales bacterium]
MAKTRIGVIGANGQVGSEICLFLSRIPDIEVVAISRSVHGSSLLRCCGVECRHGSIETPEQAGQLVGDCEVVLDFALPKGTMPQMQGIIDRMQGAIMAGASAMRHYIYMSTMSVYRLAPEEPFYRRYGTIKSYAEKSALRLGQRHGKSVTILRLAQVHGVMQAVSRMMLRQMRDAEVTVTEGPSNTVFVFSIAEAVEQIVRGNVAQGTYTLVSNPAWSWSDIHRYYAKQLGLEARIRTVAAPKPGPQWMPLRNLVAAVRKEISALAYCNRDLIDDLVTKMSEDMSLKIRARHAQSRVRRDVAQDPRNAAWAPYPAEFVAPGARLACLSDSRVTMDDAAREVNEVLDRSVKKLCDAATQNH